jgi:hypothetical protein
MFSTGYTPPEKKICIKCEKPHTNQLSLLCDDCNAEILEEKQLELDRREQTGKLRGGMIT